MRCPGYRNKRTPPDWWPSYTPWQYLTKVWYRHPISHTRCGFWRHFPHKPGWELFGWSYGTLEHDPTNTTESVAGVMKQCCRCSFIAEDAP